MFAFVLRSNGSSLSCVNTDSTPRRRHQLPSQVAFSLQIIRGIGGLARQPRAGLTARFTHVYKNRGRRPRPPLFSHATQASWLALLRRCITVQRATCAVRFDGCVLCPERRRCRGIRMFSPRSGRYGATARARRDGCRRPQGAATGRVSAGSHAQEFPHPWPLSAGRGGPSSESCVIGVSAAAGRRYGPGLVRGGTEQQGCRLPQGAATCGV